MQRKLRGLYVKENELPQEITFPNTLKAKQELVNGCIEYTRILSDDNILLICNEEGKINGMNPNRDIGHDVIFGPFVIVADDPESGEDRSLSDDQISMYMNYFGKQSIENTNKKVELIQQSKEMFI